MAKKPVAVHRPRGRDTRIRVLASTVGIARAEGLEALTIGRVSSMNSLTKAGLLGHFPSKLALQMSTIDRGREEFRSAVALPASRHDPGAERLGAVLQRWTTYTDGLGGGCMYASIASEFDSRPGEVRDRIARDMGEWLAFLEGEVATGLGNGEFRAATDAARLAFELQGILLSMNLRRQLADDIGARDMAKASILDIVAARATRKGKAAFHRGWEAA